MSTYKATENPDLKLIAPENLPHAVREIEHTWIEMSDGTRLAARIWLPEDAEQEPVPTIFEFIPYRQNDITAVRDSMNHRYFAGHGYAAIRVDLRGSGNSEGVLKDEYLQQELDDGVEVLDWIARQPWSDGQVGMMGISWGGFNSLQIAAMQPEPLKAIVTVCSTDNRYTDDVHYMGGCQLGDNLSWASVMFAFNACPPDPRNVGEKWRQMWFERLENSGLWIKNWLEHPHYDEFWKHGSICEDYSAVQTPVLAASGWADGYTNSVFRMMDHLECPRKGLVGPWSHKYPHQGVPGPAIGFLQECLRWWDHWMKKRNNGIMEEPMVRMWLQDASPPYTRYESRPGSWISEDIWPSPRIETVPFALAPGYALKPIADSAVRTSIPEHAYPDQSPLSVGLFAGKWCSYAAAPDLPGDQREEDGGSLIFETELLEEDQAVVGLPHVDLEITSSEPVAMVAVRLSDLAPDRKATRITYGVLNLTHRHSHEKPMPMEPGKPTMVRVYLNHVAHLFRRGHRLRIAISTSYWPLAWPAPRPARLTLHTGKSVLYLPIRPPRDEDKDYQPFQKPEAAQPVTLKQQEPEEHQWRVIRNLETDVSALEVVNDEGTYHYPANDLTVSREAREWYSFEADKFDTLSGEVRNSRTFSRGSWQAGFRTRTVLRCDENHWYINAELDAFEGDKRIFSKSWDETIKRDMI